MDRRIRRALNDRDEGGRERMTTAEEGRTAISRIYYSLLSIIMVRTEKARSFIRFLRYAQQRCAQRIACAVRRDIQTDCLTCQWAT